MIYIANMRDVMSNFNVMPHNHVIDWIQLTPFLRQINPFGYSSSQEVILILSGQF